MTTFSIKRLSLGITSSYLLNFSEIVSGLVLVPLFLSFLGGVEYGVWLAIAAWTAYLGLAELGVAQTFANRSEERRVGKECRL